MLLPKNTPQSAFFTFTDIKQILKSLTICILYLSIVCLNIEKQICFNDSKKETKVKIKWHILENLLR